MVGHKIKVCLTSMEIGQHIWLLPCRFSIHRYPYVPTYLLGFKVEFWSENILKIDSKKWCWQYSLTVHQTHTFFFRTLFCSHHNIEYKVFYYLNTTEVYTLFSQRDWEAARNLWNVCDQVMYLPLWLITSRILLSWWDETLEAS